jgi:hypothetical protein
MTFKNTSSERTLWLIILIISIIYIFRFFFYASNDDEGMIAEWAYWIINEGHARSTLAEPLGVGFDDRITVYHKLMTWLAIPLIWMFGMKVYPLKVLIFCFFLFLLFIAFKYFKKADTKNTKLHFALFLLFYSLNARVFEFSFVYRPEIILSSLGITSFYFLKVSMDENNKQASALAGLFSGLAFLTHLNGVVYLMAGFFLYLFNKKYNQLFWYTLIGGITILFYFVDMLDTNIIQAISHDLFNSPDVNNNKFTIWSPFIKILNEHQRLFQSPIEISLSILVILSLSFSKKSFFIKHKLLLSYLALIVFLMGALATGKNPKYMLIYVPFIVLVVVHRFREWNTLHSLKQKALIFFTIFYFIIQGIYIGKVFNRAYDLDNVNTKIAKNIPDNARVLAHNNLIFKGIDNFYIHSYFTFSWTKFNKNGENFEQFLNYAKSINDDYVIVTPYFTPAKYLKEIEFNKIMVGDSLHGFVVTQKDSDYAVFKTIK